MKDLSMVIMKDKQNHKIQCMICRNFFHVITASHLKKHGITVSGYQLRYPDAPIFSEKANEKRRAAMIRKWQDLEYKQEKSRKISEAWKKPEQKRKHLKSLRKIWESPKFREKLSKIKKKNWADGVYDSPEYKLKLSEGQKKSYQNPKRREARGKLSKELWKNPEYVLAHLGENNPNWRGGKSFEPYTPEFNGYFKSQVKSRDHFQCWYPDCNSSKDLMIHHIDYDKKHTTDQNCVTLCRKHNTKVNHKRDYWQKYFMKLMELRHISEYTLPKEKATYLALQETQPLLGGD